jgi:hypothetical protein
MQLFDLKQILSGCSTLSNTNELIQADILLMPAVRGHFIKDQFLFDSSISEKYQVNFKFYSDSQTSLPCILEESAIPIEHIYDLGKFVTTIVGFYKLYEILAQKVKGKKFRMENFVKVNEDSYVALKFEGTIEEYKIVSKDFKLTISKMMKNRKEDTH